MRDTKGERKGKGKDHPLYNLFEGFKETVRDKKERAQIHLLRNALDKVMYRINFLRSIPYHMSMWMIVLAIVLDFIQDLSERSGLHFIRYFIIGMIAIGISYFLLVISLKKIYFGEQLRASLDELKHNFRKEDIVLIKEHDPNLFRDIRKVFPDVEEYFEINSEETSSAPALN